ncbi:MAG: DUF2188 domain-containing protein [Phenylobacterium sp.]|uniref:DUF2188 domain-containing protein n=1 Tax=Phenylobacterium sp. TaxID=1871053 RepID=UPI0025F95756|nr:DUF2188 domain-containing protein [Phenylobacterium sp.]MBI1196479.1 DUF2188 domain-containing protein [Phenylobacterium sp.]
MTTLTVRPVASGWAVTVAGVANEMMFRSGAAAEAAARRLAERLAAKGEPSKLVIRLRDGSVAGRFLFPPRAPKPAAPRWREAA